MKRKFITLALICSLTLPLGRVVNADEADASDLSGAFNALKQSLGQSQPDATDEALDTALEEAFDPLPEEIRESGVAIDQVSDEKSDEARKSLSLMPIDAPLDIEYQQRGTAVSLVLWKGSREAVQSLLANILKQLYSDNDGKNFRFIVNSNPIPEIHGRNADLNRERRDAAIAEAERQSKSLLNLGNVVIPSDIPEKPGVEITISAGMLATVKSVDELAGQIARVLAALKPEVYGVREDTRFTRNQKYLALIDQLIEGADEKDRQEASTRRNMLLAEFSAIERLAAGGFNPWSLYNYDERVYSWMADVYMKSRNHSLGRWLVNAKKYNLQDWALPLRLQLQSYYMQYLQSVERGKGMNLVDTEFSSRMKFMRLRMNLFTQPFFSGLVKQGAAMTLASGAAVTAVFFPEVAHLALSALNVTAGSGAVEAAPTVIATGAASTVGQLTAGAQAISKPLLDAVVAGYEASGAGTAVSSAASAFMANWEVGVATGSSTIGAGLLAKYSKSIGTVLRSASKQIGGEKKNKKTDEIFTQPASQNETHSQAKTAASAPTEVISTMGTLVPAESRAIRIGNKLGGFVTSAGSGLRVGRTKLGEIFVAGGRGIVVSAKAVKRGTVGTGVALYNFGIAGRNAAIVGAKGAANKAVAGWNTLIKVAKASPDATVRAAEGISQIAIRVGVGTGKATGKGVKLAGKGLAKGSAAIFIHLPVAVAGGTLAVTTATLNAVAKKYAAGQERFEALKERNARVETGRNRIESVLVDENATLDQIADLMKELANLPHTGSNETWEKLGFKKPNPTKIEKPIEALFAEWIKKAKVSPPNDEALIRVANAMIRFYDRYAKRNFRSLDSEFIENGTALLEMLDHSKHPNAISLVSKKADPSSFVGVLSRLQQARAVRQDLSGEGIAAVLTNGTEVLNKTFMRELYNKNEGEIAKWMAAPSTSSKDIEHLRWAIPGKGSLFNRIRFFSALKKLSDLERAAIHLRMRDGWISAFADNEFDKAEKLLNRSLPAQARSWLTRARSIQELTSLIESETKKQNIDPMAFSAHLRQELPSHPELILNYEDFRLLMAKDYFWPLYALERSSSPLERPLVALLNAKRAQFGDSPAWKYDPIDAEKSHTLIKRRLIELKAFPTSFAGLSETWKLLTERGVSTITDDILGQLLKMGTPEQINDLEFYSVQQGRVFDQGLRDEFAVRQIKLSKPYLRLMRVANKPGTDRALEIREVIEVAQSLMTDLGIRYVDLMEELSVAIQSTYEEAEMFHEAKAKRLIGHLQTAGSGANDSRIRMLHEILPYIKNWKDQNQYDFLLYLRGSIEATPFIEAQFPSFGPERIRKIYQGLPLESKMAVVNLYLSETILARKEVNEGYGKKLMDFLVSNGTDAQTREYAGLLLEGLLVGIAEANNKPFQRQVLSALVAMTPTESGSVGETMKLILEQFPGVGPKIGQFLVATGLLPDEINKVLVGTQDNTLPPKRFDMYTDLSLITGRKHDLGIHLISLLGAGSLKYSMKAKEMRTRTDLALQVFREDVQNNSELQIKVLDGTIRYLINKGGKKWAFLQVIVDGAVNAVAREKRSIREAAKAALARRVYSGFNSPEFTVAVPEQQLVNKRLLTSRYAKGTSFMRLSPEDQQQVGVKLLEMEAQVLFGQGGAIAHTYDTDRHAGNYLIDVRNENGGKHYVISPIDFGQLTWVRTDQRERVIELFSFAAMLGQMGSNDWLAARVGALFDLKDSDLKELTKTLAEFFPVGKGGGSVVTNYFSLIAAINESIRDSSQAKLHRDLKDGRLDFAYTDFVRAIIQLNQYEERIVIPGDAKTPRKILEERVKNSLATHLNEIELNWMQAWGVKAMNMKSWLTSVARRRTYEPVNIRMTREELDRFTIMKNATGTSNAKSPPAQGPMTCEAIFSAR